MRRTKTEERHGRVRDADRIRWAQVPGVVGAAAGQAQCRPGGDPGDFRRQQPYPRRHRALRQGRLSGGRARLCSIASSAISISAIREAISPRAARSWEVGLGQVAARSRGGARMSLSSLGRSASPGSAWRLAAWLCAARLKFNAAVCYYGGADSRLRQGKTPLSDHLPFRERRMRTFRMSMVDEIKAAQPKVPVFIYEAWPWLRLRPARLVQRGRARRGLEAHASRTFGRSCKVFRREGPKEEKDTKEEKFTTKTQRHQGAWCAALSCEGDGE